MKWISLLWSIVLLGLLTLILAYLSSRPSDAIIDRAFGYGLTVWIIVCIVSPIILILRLFRIIQSSSSFIYILIGTASIAIGILGLYFIGPGDHFKNKTSILSILSLNVLIGLFIYVDAFVITIPGFRKNISGKSSHQASKP